MMIGRKFLSRGLGIESIDLYALKSDEFLNHYLRIWGTTIRTSIALIVLSFFCIFTFYSPDENLISTSALGPRIPVIDAVPFILFQFIGPLAVLGIWLYLRAHIELVGSMRRHAESREISLPPVISDRTNLSLSIAAQFVGKLLVPVIFLGFAIKIEPANRWLSIIYLTIATIALVYEIVWSIYSLNIILKGVITIAVFGSVYVIFLESRFDFLDRRFEFMQATLNGQAFVGYDFDRAWFFRPNLSGSWFRQSRIRHASFVYPTAEEVDFRYTNLSETQISQGNFFNADFESAFMIDSQLLRADFRRADFEYVCAIGARFTDSSLEGAFLGDGIFCGAVFDDVNLLMAELDNACVNGASFRDTDLRGTNLRNVLGLSPRQLNGSCFARRSEHEDFNSSCPQGQITQECLDEFGFPGNFLGSMIPQFDYCPERMMEWEDGLYVPLNHDWKTPEQLDNPSCTIELDPAEEGKDDYMVRRILYENCNRTLGVEHQWRTAEYYEVNEAIYSRPADGIPLRYELCN